MRVDDRDEITKFMLRFSERARDIIAFHGNIFSEREILARSFSGKPGLTMNGI